MDAHRRGANQLLGVEIMKLCRNCRWCLYGGIGGPFCGFHPASGKPDYVNGGEIFDHQQISTPVTAQRHREDQKGCGPDAKFYVEKLKAINALKSVTFAAVSEAINLAKEVFMEMSI